MRDTWCVNEGATDQFMDSDIFTHHVSRITHPFSCTARNTASTSSSRCALPSRRARLQSQALHAALPTRQRGRRGATPCALLRAPERALPLRRAAPARTTPAAALLLRHY